MSREDYVSKCHDYSLRFSFLFTYRFSLVVTNKDAQYISDVGRRKEKRVLSL